MVSIILVCRTSSANQTPTSCPKKKKRRRTKAENPAQPRLYRRCDVAHEIGDKKVLKYTEKTRVGKPRTASVDAPDAR
jgi:hypothetical protein